jgi:hypothetical protein
MAYAFSIPGIKKPKGVGLGLGFGRLAIPYFRTANCRTIIGAKRFHFRVRDGIGWFTLAMVTKQTGVKSRQKMKGPRRKLCFPPCSPHSSGFLLALLFFASAFRLPLLNSSQAWRGSPGFLFSLSPCAFCLLFGNLYVLSLALASSTLQRWRCFGLFLPFALRLP